MGISREQALACGASDDLIGIGMEADAVRRGLHPEGVVSYVVTRTVCCDGAGLVEKVAEAMDFGASGLVLQGGGELPVAEYEAMLKRIRQQAPSMSLHGLSATVVVRMAAASGRSVPETLLRMQGAGLDSLAGDDGGMLDDAVQTGERRCPATEWLEVHRMAHGLGLPSTATMRFGAGETMEHRAGHLELLRQLQEETGGFTAFLPSSFRPPMAGMVGFEEPTAVEYLRMLAVSRIVLDNIPHVEADWTAQGLKVLQMALRFGADDVGSVLGSESLRNEDGTTEEDLRRVIRGAGLRPVERDASYRKVFLN